MAMARMITSNLLLAAHLSNIVFQFLIGLGKKSLAPKILMKRGMENYMEPTRILIHIYGYAHLDLEIRS